MVGLHDVEALLIDKKIIWEHSLHVAHEIKGISRRYALDEEICRISALCHDLGGILAPAEMVEKANALNMPLDPAELQHPFLLHQRFSEAICREKLHILDARILEAVGCHTTLKANPTPYDMALYIADKLAWDQSGSPPYEKMTRKALAISLEAACLAHIDYALCNGMILTPHRWLLEARSWLIPFAASS